MWLFSALQVGEETDHRCLPRHALQGPDRLGGWPRPETPWLLLLYFGAVRPIPVARGAPARPPQHCFQVRGWFASLLHLCPAPKQKPADLSNPFLLLPPWRPQSLVTESTVAFFLKRPWVDHYNCPNQTFWEWKVELTKRDTKEMGIKCVKPGCVVTLVIGHFRIRDPYFIISLYLISLLIVSHPSHCFPLCLPWPLLLSPHLPLLEVRGLLLGYPFQDCSFIMTSSLRLSG